MDIAHGFGVASFPAVLILNRDWKRGARQVVSDRGKLLEEIGYFHIPPQQRIKMLREAMNSLFDDAFTK
jgi:hypothetical protein